MTDGRERQGWIAVAVLLMSGAACGGRSTQELDPRAGDGGSRSGVGGTKSTGGTMASVGGSKSSGGTTSVGGTGGTTLGVGGTTSVGGTDSGSGGFAGDGCIDGAGVFHGIGSTYLAPDGCNTCTCTQTGNACTNGICEADVCDALASEFNDVATRVMRCTSGVDTCGEVAMGLSCACPFYVTDAAELARISAEYAMQGCPMVACSCTSLYPEHVCSRDGYCAALAPGGAGTGSSGFGGMAGTTAAAGFGGVAGAFSTGGLGGLSGGPPSAGFGGSGFAGSAPSAGFGGFAGAVPTAGFGGFAAGGAPAAGFGGLDGASGSSSTASGGFATD